MDGQEPGESEMLRRVSNIPPKSQGFGEGKMAYGKLKSAGPRNANTIRV